MAHFGMRPVAQSCIIDPPTVTGGPCYEQSPYAMISVAFFSSNGYLRKNYWLDNNSGQYGQALGQPFAFPPGGTGCVTRPCLKGGQILPEAKYGAWSQHGPLVMDQRGQACVIGVIDHSLCKGQKHR